MENKTEMQEFIGDRCPVCPVCGEKLSGGSKNTCYYKCGGHFWIEYEPNNDMWVMKGHCHSKDKEIKNGK